MLKFTLPAIILFFSPLVAARPLLTVYTHDFFASEWGPGPIVKKAFEAQCNCKLKYVVLGDGVMLFNRLRMEGNRTAADVVVGLDNNLMGIAEDTGLFAPANIDLSPLRIPGGWNNKTFMPYDYGWLAFIYDKTKLANPPTSLHQLIDGDTPVKVIYPDPRTSTPGLGLLLWVQKVFGDNAAHAWHKLAKKTVTVTKGWGEAYGLFLKGEADMVLSYTTSPAYHLIEQNRSQFAAASFSEGHYLQVEVAAKLKSSKHPQLADKFMAFILSDDVQKLIPSTNWMYPVIATPLPVGYATLTKPAITLQYGPQEVANHRTTWVNSWQLNVSR